MMNGQSWTKEQARTIVTTHKSGLPPKCPEDGAAVVVHGVYRFQPQRRGAAVEEAILRCSQCGATTTYQLDASARS